MAKIPLAEGTERLTTQAPAVRQKPGIFSTEIARASQEFARTAGAVAKQFEEVQTLAEKTRASTNALRSLKELNLEAESARTIDDITKFRSEYPNRISKIREDANKLITLPQAKNEFGRAFDKDSLAFDFSIKKTLRTNQNGALTVILDDAEIDNRDSYINGDAVTQHISKTNQNLLDIDARNRGVITTKQLGERKIKRDKEWELAWVDKEIEVDAEAALAQLQRGDEGIFSNVDSGDRNTKMATANTRIQRDKVIAKRNLEDKVNTSELALATKIINNQATVNEVNQAELLGNLGAEGGISKDFATIARRAVESAAAVNPETVANSFVKLQDQFVDLSIKVYTHKKQKKAKVTDKDVDIEDISKFRRDVIESWGNGEITAANAENWLEAVSLVWDKALEKRTKGLGREAAKEVAGDVRSGKIKDLRNFWGRISFWTDEFATDKAEVKSRLGAELMQRLLSDPKSGDEIVDELIEKEQKNMNPNKTQYKIDQKVNTPSGVWKVVDFDGDGEPILELIK